MPDQPTALIEMVATKTSTSVTFSWIAPLNDGGSAITSYEIWSNEGGIMAKTHVTSGTSFTLTGLNSGTTY